MVVLKNATADHETNNSGRGKKVNKKLSLKIIIFKYRII